jgi:hypothetical protein
MTIRGTINDSLTAFCVTCNSLSLPRALSPTLDAAQDLSGPFQR